MTISTLHFIQKIKILPQNRVQLLEFIALNDRDGVLFIVSLQPRKSLFSVSKITPNVIRLLGPNKIETTDFDFSHDMEIIFTKGRKIANLTNHFLVCMYDAYMYTHNEW